MSFVISLFGYFPKTRDKSANFKSKQKTNMQYKFQNFNQFLTSTFAYKKLIKDYIIFPNVQNFIHKSAD